VHVSGSGEGVDVVGAEPHGGREESRFSCVLIKEREKLSTCCHVSEQSGLSKKKKGKLVATITGQRGDRLAVPALEEGRAAVSMVLRHCRGGALRLRERGGGGKRGFRPTPPADRRRKKRKGDVLSFGGRRVIGCREKGKGIDK